MSPHRAVDAGAGRKTVFDFGQLVEQLPVIVYLDLLDESEPSLYVSSSLQDILGYPTTAWLEDDEFWYDHIHPDDRDRVWDAYEASVAASVDRQDEYRMLAADGRVVWIEERAHVIAGVDGERGLIQGVMLDVTDRKRAERLKDTLLRSVSHDLKSPLAAIIGAVQTMMLPELSFSEADRLRFLRDIAVSARRMDQMVSDLMDLERLERGAVMPRFELADLADLLRDATDGMSGYGHRLEVDPSPAVLRVDRAMVERIIDNLVRNAIRHSPEGSEIRLSAEMTGEGAILRVDDNGPGIPESLREQVFEPFVQVGEGRGGAGVGLALVREFAELHGGRAWVEASESGGAAFRVLLPSR